MKAPKFEFPTDPPPKQLADTVEVLIDDYDAESVLDALQEIKRKLPREVLNSDINIGEIGDDGALGFYYTSYYPNPNFDSEMKGYQEKLKVAQKEYESFLLEYKRN